MSEDRNLIHHRRRQSVRTKDVNRRCRAIKACLECRARDVTSLYVCIPRARIHVIRVVAQVIVNRATHAGEQTKSVALIKRVARTRFDDAPIDVRTYYARVVSFSCSQIPCSFFSIDRLERGKRFCIQKRRYRVNVDVECAGNRRCSKFGRHAIVDVGNFGISRMAAPDVVISVAADQITFLGKLEIVSRGVVERTRTRTERTRIVEEDRVRSLVEIANSVIGRFYSRGARIVPTEARTKAAGTTHVCDRTIRRRSRTELLLRSAKRFTAKSEVGETALPLENRIAIVIFSKDRSMTATFVEARTDRTMDFITCAIATLGDRILTTDFDAFDLLEAEVHNTGQSVRTINSRSTAGYDVNRIKQERRDGIKIDNLRRIVRQPPATVDKDQSPSSTKTTKVQGSRSVTWIVREGCRSWNNLRQLVDDVFNVDGARQLEFFVLNNCDRRSRFNVTTSNARAGYDDRRSFFNLRGRLRCRFILLIVNLSICWRSNHGTRHDGAGQQRSF